MKKFLLFLTILFVCCTFSKANAINDKVRETSYYKDVNNNWRCDIDPLNFLPYWGLEGFKNGGDLSFEFGNPLCVTYASVYATSLAAVAGSSVIAGVLIGGALGAIATLTVASAGFAVTTGLLVAAFGVIYINSASVFDAVEVCGSNWLVWGNNKGDNPKDFYPTMSDFKGSYKDYVDNCIKDKNKCKEGDKPANSRNYFSIENKVYREYINQGMEFESKLCSDPREERGSYDVGGVGQLYYTRGYFPTNYACDRFLKNKDKARETLFKEAYNCCLRSSKNSICLTKNKSFVPSLDNYVMTTNSAAKRKAVFCRVPNKNIRNTKNFFEQFDLLAELWNDTSKSYEGNICKFDNLLSYQVYRGDNPDKICAKTYSLCPYNHNVGGGTEIKEFYRNTFNKETEKIVGDCIDSKTGAIKSCNNQIKNFCQLNKHCTTVKSWDKYTRKSRNLSPYFDMACINMVGSSHNTKNFETYFGWEFVEDRANGYRVFTAPIAECFNESMKNLLFNKAGHTRCENEDCENGAVVFKKGQDLSKIDNGLVYISSVDKLQKALRNIVKVLLILVLTIFGVKTIMNQGELKKNDILTLITKIVIVWTFAYSPWWYNQMFQFVYGASNSFSSIVMNLLTEDIDYIELKKDYGVTIKESQIKSDGCYFGYNPYFDNNYKAYGDLKYLTIFDMLDCKLTNYLGYNLNKIPEILTMLAIPVTFFTGGALFVVMIFVVFLFISFALKAAYIFVLSGIALAIMLFMAPIMVPMILFDRTKDVFKSWLNNVISFALQPMILFAYVTFSIILLDRYIYGDALFIGESPKKIMLCSKYCKSAETNEILRIYGHAKDNSEQCTQEGNIVVDIKNSSYICALENLFGTIHTKQVVIFNIPFWNIIEFLIKGHLILLLKVVFLIYILNKMMNKIPSIASTLTGGTELPGTKDIWGVKKIKDKVWSTKKDLEIFANINIGRALKITGGTIGMANLYKKSGGKKGVIDGGEDKGEGLKNMADKTADVGNKIKDAKI